MPVLQKKALFSAFIICQVLRIIQNYMEVSPAKSLTSVYYHDNDSWPAHAPVCMWFDYGVLNDFLKEWVVRIDELSET